MEVILLAHVLICMFVALSFPNTCWDRVSYFQNVGPLCLIKVLSFCLAWSPSIWARGASQVATSRRDIASTNRKIKNSNGTYQERLDILTNHRTPASLKNESLPTRQLQTFEHLQQRRYASASPGRPACGLSARCKLQHRVASVSTHIFAYNLSTRHKFKHHVETSRPRITSYKKNTEDVKNKMKSQTHIVL